MFYLLDKPKGISSFSAIRSFAKENNIKKVGHTGTLDPLATGLLLIATEEDTKLIDYVDKGSKSYRVDLKFGFVSDTFDSEGIVEQKSNSKVSIEQLKEAIKNFEGKTMQTPPSFSAKKINGDKAYDLARRGEEVKLKPVEVEMTDFKNFNEIKENVFEFEVTVSRGTYIRSLVNDLGNLLGTGAIMTELRRITIGNLSEKDLNKEAQVEELLILPILELENIDALVKGQKPENKTIKPGKYILKYKGIIVGVIEAFNKYLKTVKIFGNKLKEVE